MNRLFLLPASACLLLLGGCGAHKNGSKTQGKDTTYVIHGKDATEHEVKVTDGDTTIEEMELEHAVIPVAK